MKLGLISDVHGDLKALHQALDLLKNRHHVQAIWCAGDLVGRGQQPNEVVAYVSAASIPTVMGNHDEVSLLMQRLYPSFNGGIKPETLAILRSLPRTYRARLDGRNVVMVHGTPRSNTESLTLMPGSRDRALAWLGKVGAQILIAGHTHVPMFVQDQRGLVVNPGSLFDPRGFDRSSSETYGVLDVSNMSFSHYPLWD